MLGMTVEEVARALDGTLLGRGEDTVNEVVTDSRRIRRGDLFVALPGARTDGHNFLRQASEAGAAAVLVQPDRGLRPPDLPAILVPDTLHSLGALAHRHLGRLGAEVVGITGTVGKTTAKDILGTLLGGPSQRVHVAPASFNSECGLPQAVLGAGPGTKFLVLEYGVNAPGEMQRLVEIARPHHAWLTAMTETHLEGMGSLQTIIQEKSLLATSVPESGRIWFHQELASKVAEQRQNWCARVAISEAQGERSRGDNDSETPWCVDLPKVGKVSLPVVAAHEAQLVAVAVQAALDLGVSPEDVRERLTQIVRPVGRLTIHEFHAITVIDDSYNASPAAMRAALKVMADWDQPGRRVAVLGTMHELGAAAEQLHRDIGAYLVERKCDLLVGVGRGGAWIAAAAREQDPSLDIYVVDDVDAAAKTLAHQVQVHDRILLKASRAETLEKLIEPLEQIARRLCAQPGAVLRSSPLTQPADKDPEVES